MVPVPVPVPTPVPAPVVGAGAGAYWLLLEALPTLHCYYGAQLTALLRLMSIADEEPP
ncbi:hypothetical protein BU24DRAFT_420151 [Aaosphaeria arxii CBS 175.79]|uniref:Uncharacterized protein n=1 Tax=Aaosphaeria arxii CBS 175.79 TaxID=1450172 RepID=A0A6A5XUZ0_9PLEO|nr:uncharacterized protein BU24DRAFT_420151 [Aaosphaeria arxii CBS 175.79]KAF2017128.1 hypothetical protein BU24DRAFT_420151 [Aaosphaeria arxii CBS 175.79]